MYACLYQPPQADDDQRRTGGTRRENWVERSASSASSASNVVAAIAQAFSPRYECHHADLVTIDVSGLDRLLGPPRTIGEELRRACADRGLRAHVAIASTWTAAAILAHARAGLTVVARGDEAEALAPIAAGILEHISDVLTQNPRPSTGSGRPERVEGRQRHSDQIRSACSAFKRWGLKNLGEVAALPPADLVARLGRASLIWQAMARGEDVRPLVPTLEAERFESSLDLEWPIADLEPLSFVLTRLLEPLAVRLERRDRGAAVLHVVLRLVTREMYARRMELPSPMRDVRTLRTLALLDLESHPAPAAIDRVTIVIDPTPGRVLQHTLFTRAHPTPEQISTLLARLAALMGHDRIGAPADVDSYRPGAFAMIPFATEHGEPNRTRRNSFLEDSASSALNVVTSALRRCRHPVPARVAVDAGGRPARVTTDRRGFAGGSVVACAGPWRTSGNWWASDSRKSEVRSQKSDVPGISAFRLQTSDLPWDRDEWDVSLNDGAVYRIFQDRASDAWFIDAIVD
ncbi:MAG TPA: hypothetical protein VGY57_07475 [Vicinamibacterales bacterium]|nr:hypothetical protein [Vicinamibacterales bacterium]